MQWEAFFQTDLILSTARAFLPHAAKSIMHPPISPENPLIGLYALILTAICHLLAAWSANWIRWFNIQGRVHLDGLFTERDLCNTERLQTQSLLEATQPVHKHTPNQGEQMMLDRDSRQPCHCWWQRDGWWWRWRRRGKLIRPFSISCRHLHLWKPIKGLKHLLPHYSGYKPFNHHEISHLECIHTPFNLLHHIQYFSLVLDHFQGFGGFA